MTTINNLFQVSIIQDSKVTECGGICCFADDNNTDTLSTKLSEKYNVMAEYMVSNELKLNDDKTHVLIMTTSQKRRKRPVYCQITTPTEIIEPSKTEKLLGIMILEDMKWAHYILHDDNSLIVQLNRRLGALKKISKVASFKTRLMIANGTFMSKLIYMIQLWSGCEKYLTTSLQILQNKVARTVTNHGLETPIKTLLQQCGWLSVNQLSCYHTLILQHKIIHTKSPTYLYEKLSLDYPYRTRISDNRLVRMGPQSKNELELTNKSFRWRAVSQWNKLPLNIRKIEETGLFKQKLRAWVTNNVPIQAT